MDNKHYENWELLSSAIDGNRATIKRMEDLFKQNPKGVDLNKLISMIDHAKEDTKKLVLAETRIFGGPYSVHK